VAGLRALREGRKDSEAYGAKQGRIIRQGVRFQRRDFERVRGLIYQRAGIALADSKQEMVYSRLARRLRATGITSFQQYIWTCSNAPTTPTSGKPSPTR
jgi:chemotaxis protein methyltransferase CheR